MGENRHHQNSVHSSQFLCLLVEGGRQVNGMDGG